MLLPFLFQIKLTFVNYSNPPFSPFSPFFFPFLPPHGELYAPVCTKGKKNIPPIGIFCKPTEDRSQVGDEILLGSYQNLKSTEG